MLSEYITKALFQKKDESKRDGRKSQKKEPKKREKKKKRGWGYLFYHVKGVLCFLKPHIHTQYTHPRREEEEKKKK